MKTKIILLILVTLGFFQNVYSQTYFPFPNSSQNPRWSVENWTIPNTVPPYTPYITSTIFYGGMGDTLINGKMYMKVYTCSTLRNDTSFNPDSAIYACAIRESNKKIFKWALTEDQMYYDFGLVKGDTIKIYYPDGRNRTMLGIDSVLIDGVLRKKWVLSENLGQEIDQGDWIEGIGATSGLFENNFLIGNVYSTLLCYSENGKVFYSKYGTCNRYIPTGVKENESSLSIIQVYPNPVGRELTIISQDSQPLEITLYNSLLQKVLQKSISGKDVLMVENLLPGIYFYEVTSENKVLLRNKLIKK